MPSGDEIRDAQRATWAGLSASWEKWDSVIMDQLGPVGSAMIEGLGIAEDHQHLDIASGTGEPGLSIARLAPKGRVVLTDLAAEMLDVAARRARAQGVANIETKVCSADELPFNDATFDSVSVRFGYMFFPDVAKATAEFARVLKPGGQALIHHGKKGRTAAASWRSDMTADEMRRLVEKNGLVIAEQFESWGPGAERLWPGHAPEDNLDTISRIQKPAA